MPHAVVPRLQSVAWRSYQFGVMVLIHPSLARNKSPVKDNAFVSPPQGCPTSSPSLATPIQQIRKNTLSCSLGSEVSTEQDLFTRRWGSCLRRKMRDLARTGTGQWKLQLYQEYAPSSVLECTYQLRGMLLHRALNDQSCPPTMLLGFCISDAPNPPFA